MYRSRRELPGDIRRPDFPHPRQRGRRTSDIMRLSNASPFDGSAREESEKVWEKVCKTSEKDRMKIQLRNNSDSSDDKIRLASK